MLHAMKHSADSALVSHGPETGHRHESRPRLVQFLHTGPTSELLVKGRVFAAAQHAPPAQ